MMKQKYFYHEHLADYAMMKTKGMKSRDELYGSLDFSDFSSKSFLTETLPRLDVKAGARVLELGCGTGSGACFLSELGYQVHGIDVIPDAVDKAREIAAERGLDIEYEVMDVCHLPHEGKPYELIIDSYCSQGIVTDEDRAAMFSGVKARLASRGYFLMSCSVFEQHRETSEIRIVDEVSGKVFTAFDDDDLWDGDTETCYNQFSVDPLRPYAGPEDYEGTILVNGAWYIHRRRYRTPENLRAELEGHGFKVLEQNGDVIENAICTHRGVSLPLKSTTEAAGSIGRGWSGRPGMRYGDLTYEEIREKAGLDWLAIVPTGCTEQQGPHLPVDFDTWFVEQICTAAAEKADREHGVESLVLPTIPFGPTPEHRNYAAGYVDVPVDLHDSLVLAILASLAEQGFRRIVVWRGCGGHDLRETVERFNESHNLRSTAFLPGLPYHNVWCRIADPSIPGGHADSFTTSIMLHLRPEAVRRDRNVDPQHRPVDWEDPDIDFANYSSTGVIGDPTHASAELGAKLWAAVIDEVAATLRSIAEDCDPTSPVDEDRLHFLQR